MSENNINENPAGEKLNSKEESTNNSVSGNELTGIVYSNAENSEPHSNEAETSQSINSDPAPSDKSESETGINEEPESRFQEFFNETVEENNPKLTDTLLTFYELRGIDEELTDIEYEKGDLPDKIESIKSEIGSIVKVLEEKKRILLKLDEEKSGLTTDNNSYEERINKYDEQKYDVRSNKEYDEIVKTIDSLFEEVKKNELRLKEIVEVHTKHSTEAEAYENKSKELSAELSEKQTLLDELDEQYKTEESGLKEKRNILLDKINARDKNLYERINKSYKGEATAIVRKGNCSGCYNSIPPQRVIEIKSAEKIFTCQSCGRILIAEEIISSRDN